MSKLGSRVRAKSTAKAPRAKAELMAAKAFTLSEQRKRLLVREQLDRLGSDPFKHYVQHRSNHDSVV